MKTIGGFRLQDLDMLEGNSQTILALIQSIRQLQNQLDAIDKELQWSGTGFGRIDVIKKLKENQK
jgi:hypothetical protein